MESISGEAGNFEVKVKQNPRYVDVDKCIACAQCAEKCPKKVDNEYDAALGKRKAIYIKYAQAVPLKYTIDADHCIYLQKGKCRACEKICPTGAVNFDDQPKELTIHAGAVLIAPGCSVFDPASYDAYGYKKTPNVVTSLEFERILSATGPFGGHVIRPSDQKVPEKIAWLQCVGSRDVNKCDNAHCSSVCCMYAIKEAVIAKEHAGEDLDCAIFYMDMRTFGKDFERYYMAAEEKQGVRFIRSKVHTVNPILGTDDLELRYMTESGEIKTEVFDMIVLSVGLETPAELVDLSNSLDVDLTDVNFCQTSSFAPVETSQPGIFVCGAFQGPKDIPQSVIESSACAAAAQSLLAESRFSLTKTKKILEEIDVRGEDPRIGVFVCHCGTNIAGVIDVADTAEYARTLPHVVHVEENLFSCSQDTQDKITQVIKEQKLNRIVVAACSPRTHEALFQETVVNAGINKYLFEMANIRNQCSWVHSGDAEAATAKAKDLVRIGVAKVGLLEPLPEPEIEINPSALIVGGGLSGMVAAKNLAQQGYHTYLVEKSNVLGGQALNLHKTWRGENVQENLSELIQFVESNENIDVFLKSELKSVDGFVGNFKSAIETAGKEQEIEHGAAIIATGAAEFKPDQYLYGQDPRVLTALELDRKFIDNDPSLKKINTAVLIQCVGSREPQRPYCSKVCCTHSIESAMELKRRNPEMNVFILYRDIRTYGEKELLYTEARQAGVYFIRYSLDRKPEVILKDGNLSVRVIDHVLGRSLEIETDLVNLASAIIPTKDEQLAQLFKVPVNEDGFFVEAHAKLRPIDFATDGIFVCGLAHCPKPVDEAIAQGMGAASRSVSLLSKGKMFGNAIISWIDPMICRGCRKCLNVCPYQAINYLEDRMICEINQAVCKGCGACAVECPTGAADNRHFTDKEMLTMVEAALGK